MTKNLMRSLVSLENENMAVLKGLMRNAHKLKGRLIINRS